MSHPGRRLLVCAIVLVSAGLASDARAGAIRGPVPAQHDWHRIVVAPDGDIVEALEKIPHDANPLGAIASAADRVARGVTSWRQGGPALLG